MTPAESSTTFFAKTKRGYREVFRSRTMHCALASTLLVLMFAKLDSPYRVELAIPRWAYFASAAIEGLIASLLVLRWTRLACQIGILACGTAILASWWIKGDCG